MLRLLFMTTAVKIQYAMAVLLISSSIALAFVQTLTRDDMTAGVLTYIAQAFLLAGSIFGLDAYVRNLVVKYGAKRGTES